MGAEKACYGTMFPDLDRLQYNQPLEGRAFRVLVQSSGIGVQRRTTEVKRKGWEECVACPHYRDCYDLSVGKLLLHMAVGEGA